MSSPVQKQGEDRSKQFVTHTRNTLNFPSNHGNTLQQQWMSYTFWHIWLLNILKTDMTPGSWGGLGARGALLSHRRGSWTGSGQPSISQTSVLEAGISLFVTYCHLSVQTHTQRAITATPRNTGKLEQPRYTYSPPPPPSAPSSGSQQVRVAETQGLPVASLTSCPCNAQGHLILAKEASEIYPLPSSANISHHSLLTVTQLPPHAAPSPLTSQLSA